MTPGGWTTEQSALLLWLRGIWDGKYHIRDPCDHRGAWIAERIDSVGTVTAETGQELRLLLSRDARDWNNETYVKDKLGPDFEAPLAALTDRRQGVKDTGLDSRAGPGAPRG